jgi:acyl-CoA thioester hydrolase
MNRRRQGQPVDTQPWVWNRLPEMAERQLPKLTDFPIRSIDKIRYRDTDQLGHVNNAVFSTFFETGRAELLVHPDRRVAAEGASIVIASLFLEYYQEITWPGEIQIGTRVLNVGRSSVKLEQALYQNDQCVARAETVLVQIDDVTRKSTPLSESAVAELRKLSGIDSAAAADGRS